MCIFADRCDLAAAQEVLVDLPADAYGQVYVASEGWPGHLVTPERVQINWVQPYPGRCALTDAMAAWAAEWLPDGAGPGDHTPTVWVLPGAAAAVTASGDECVTRLITVLPSDQFIHG